MRSNVPYDAMTHFEGIYNVSGKSYAYLGLMLSIVGVVLSRQDGSHSFWTLLNLGGV